MAFTTILMGLCTKASGKMTYSMVKAKKVGLIIPNMMESTWPVKSMDRVLTNGMMDQNIPESGSKIKLKAMELILGWMVVCSKENGLIIIWTAWVSTHGKMVGAIWANTKTIKSMDTVFISGPMEGCTLDIGKGVNNMDLVSTELRKPISSTAFGKKAKESNGLNRMWSMKSILDSVISEGTSVNRKIKCSIFIQASLSLSTLTKN